MNNLNELLEGGYVKLDVNFTDYHIYAKGDKKVLYFYKEDLIVLKYRWKKVKE